jgi:hypothetical protein
MSPLTSGYGGHCEHCEMTLDFAFVVVKREAVIGGIRDWG